MSDHNETLIVNRLQAIYDRSISIHTTLQSIAWLLGVIAVAAIMLVAE